MDEENVTGESVAESDAERADRLGRELEALKAEIGKKEEENSRMLSEYSEFSELFPDVALDSVSESVWENVKRGVPLAAAYALYDRKQYISERDAQTANEKNRANSAGAVGGTSGEEYYSPAEVRAMSREQIRANYDKITASMKKWK